MKVSITRHRLYPHDPDVMWQVFARPEVSSTLDDRVTLASSQGLPGSIGSSYELLLKIKSRAVGQRVEVVESDQPRLLRTTTYMKGRAVGDQLAELADSDGGTSVKWTVMGQVPLLLSPLMRWQVRKELARWLAAADEAAASLS